MAENAHNSWALQLKKSDGNSLEYVTYCTRYVICPDLDLGGVHPSLHTAIISSLVYRGRSRISIRGVLFVQVHAKRA